MTFARGLVSSAFVLSSKYETFGVVIVEALVLGLPVIATKCGGPESINNNRVGILSPNQSKSSLVDSMHHLINNYSDYDQKCIRKYCIDNFSKDVITNKLEKIHATVIR